MSDEVNQLDGPDFQDGVPQSALPDNAMLRGHIAGKAALLIRRGDRIFALGSACTHYGAPLNDGMVVGETIRCPWHHACFSLRTGEVLRAPALSPLPCWRVEQADGMIFVRERRKAPAAEPREGPSSVVIVGGGVAGHNAAETLRHEGYAGPITMLSVDETLPCDRPNLSKGYLSGAASDAWNLLRPAEFFERNNIAVLLNTKVVGIDTDTRRVECADGSGHDYGALLLATGAEPVRLPIAGADLPHVHYLRTLTDSRALVAAAIGARRAVVIGASFIGLEVASSLCARKIEVHVVGPEAIPMAKILGPEVGSFIRSVHERHGVTFHLGATVDSIDEGGVILSNGDRIEADLVVVGVGVRPSTALAEQAGLSVDHGVLVNEFLETSAPDVFAAGDIARWPDPLSGESIRVEHFVVAERQARTAARNMLGARERFEAVPFFWTEQHDLALAYVGHASAWDASEIDGDLQAGRCTITYRSGGRKRAVAFIGRDLEGLKAELEFEQALGREPTPVEPIIVGAIKP